jgi:hydroxymethylpyrimidine/phosphomethylpyrimidine kinase
MTDIPNVLSIAGTDPTGGAGIQADLKTFSALGAYGMAVVTAVVAQNTTGVRAVDQLSADMVAAQIDAVFEDVRVDAVKIGMLGVEPVIRTVAAAIDRWRPAAVVLDPVMVAKSGDRLLEPAAVDALRIELLPRADLLTPNLPEAADLLGEPEATDVETMVEQAQRLVAAGAGRVLVKGGHLRGAESVDVLVGAGTLVCLPAPRVDTRNDHGTGCTLSSAIAALVPQRPDWDTAVGDAKAYLTAALADAGHLDVGSGHGPVHHFSNWWSEPAPTRRRA